MQINYHPDLASFFLESPETNIQKKLEIEFAKIADDPSTDLSDALAYNQKINFKCRTFVNSDEDVYQYPFESATLVGWYFTIALIQYDSNNLSIKTEFVHLKDLYFSSNYQSKDIDNNFFEKLCTSFK